MADGSNLGAFHSNLTFDINVRIRGNCQDYRQRTCIFGAFDKARWFPAEVYPAMSLRIQSVPLLVCQPKMEGRAHKS